MERERAHLKGDCFKMLKLHNTMAGAKEPFAPLVDKTVRMYVCGVTVYDDCHIGHARSALIFDVLRRYMEFKGFSVTYARNFTDVDDKIIARAERDGISWERVARTYIDAYRRDMARLGVRPADIEPKATEHMPEMLDLIRRLEAKGIAYSSGDDVFYAVDAFRGYGKLSRRGLDQLKEELVAGARVEVDTRKRNPLDFVLWKGSKPGEPAWHGPWGSGRPGWHLECSAMSMKHLGESFEIHGGGQDLIFPHHENEIAQSEGATGKPFARYWVHNGFVTINREKMSKSLGNFFTIREIFDQSPYPEAVTGEALRALLLGTHYRSPLDFSDQAIATAKASCDNIYALLQKLSEISNLKSQISNAKHPALQKLLVAFPQNFQAAMDDDLNTARALAEFQQLRSAVNPMVEKGLPVALARAALDLIRTYGAVLGLFQLPPDQWSFVRGEWGLGPRISGALSEDDIRSLVAERDEARRKKEWARSDEIRKMLEEHGVILEDRPDGTTRIKR